MLINDLQEKRNKAITELQAFATATEITSEMRTQFDALTADVATLDGDIARLKAVEQHKEEQRGAVNRHRPNPGESNDPEERAEVRDARVKESFRSYMATGKIESRDLTVANSGVAIPTLFNPQVISAQKSYGQLYDIVNLMKTDHGNPLTIVMDDDTQHSLAAVTVGTNASETDPTLSSATLQVGNYTTGIIKVDNGLLSDAGFDVASWIQDKFAKRFFRGASNLILSGDSGAVASLATAYSTGFTSAVSGKLGYVDFATALGTLDPAYQTNAVWAMSNATLGYIIGLTDTAGRSLFLPDFGSAASGFAGTILGRPVKIITGMPAVAAGNVPVLYGDFKEGYTFRQQNPGIGILRLNELFAAGFETGFVGFARVGGVATSVGTPVIGITIKA